MDRVKLTHGRIAGLVCPTGKTQAFLRDTEVPKLAVRVQVQHQLMVSGAAQAHLWVFDGQQGLLHVVEQDPEAPVRIRAAWDEFSKYLVADTPPPLAEGDSRQRGDADWHQAAMAYLEAKREAEAAAARVEATRELLTALATHPKETGAGVTVTRFWKAGSVDYKKVVELEGVDLERYRAKAREEVRVSVATQMPNQRNHAPQSVNRL